MQPEKTPRKRAEDLISLLVPDWQPTLQQGLWAIRIGIVLGLLVAIGYLYRITLWDWAKLLIVPAVIAGGVAWLNWAQRQREREDEVAQQQRQQRAEEARRKRELELEKQRAQDEALQAYLDQMSQMLTNTERPLSRAQPGGDLSVVARARTLTVLTRLDAERKGSVVRFLYESGLITKDRRFLDLGKADLSKVGLYWADLSEADLSKAWLTQADLIRADLSKADLSGAALYDAGLIQADLSEADLSEAWMSKADLSEATVSDKQLRAAKSLKGATMPNGQKYEDWLKDREKRQQDE